MCWGVAVIFPQLLSLYLEVAGRTPGNVWAPDILFFCHHCLGTSSFPLVVRTNFPRQHNNLPISPAQGREEPEALTFKSVGLLSGFPIGEFLFQGPKCLHQKSPELHELDTQFLLVGGVTVTSTLGPWTGVFCESSCPCTSFLRCVTNDPKPRGWKRRPFIISRFLQVRILDAVELGSESREAGTKVLASLHPFWSFGSPLSSRGAVLAGFTALQLQDLGLLAAGTG